MASPNYLNIEIKKLPGSEIEITGEITAERIKTSRDKVLKHLSAEAEIPGFRKGHVPERIFLERFGEMALLHRAAEDALSGEYQNIIVEHNLSPIDNPEVTITKIAPGNPLGFKLKVVVMPDIKLPDYTKVVDDVLGKIRPEPTDVTTDEVENTIKGLRKNYAKAHNGPGEESVDGSHAGHNHEKESAGNDEKIPELNDEFIKIFGNFKDVAAFKASIKTNLLKEKEFRAKGARRLAISEALVEKTSIEVPQVLVENEIAQMIARFKDDIGRAGLKYEDYLSQIKKTEDDIRKEWRSGAEKKAKFQLILNAIAAKEKIKPADDEIKKESSHILEHHKDVDPIRVRAHVEMILTNEKVLRFLEQKNRE